MDTHHASLLSLRHVYIRGLGGEGVGSVYVCMVGGGLEWMGWEGAEGVLSDGNDHIERWSCSEGI